MLANNRGNEEKSKQQHKSKLSIIALILALMSLIGVAFFVFNIPTDIALILTFASIPSALLAFIGIILKKQRRNDKRTSIAAICISVSVIFYMTYLLNTLGVFVSYSPSSDKSLFQKYPIEETSGIENLENFLFTISPNDKWMIYTGYDIEDKRYIVFTLDLEKSKLFKFRLPKEDEPLGKKYHGIDLAIKIRNDCWTEDSRYCVIPTLGEAHQVLVNPPFQYGRRPLYVLDFIDSDNPNLVYNYLLDETEKLKFNDIAAAAYRCSNPTDVELSDPRIASCHDSCSDCYDRYTGPDIRIFMNRGAFTCSDCYDRFHEINILRRYISKKNLYYDDQKESTSRINIISKNGKKLYYTANRGGMIAIIIEYDTESKRTKKLASFFSGCTDILELKLSPNQRYLSYQVELNPSCNSWGVPWTHDLYFIDLKTNTNYFVDHADHEVHWNSQSKKLYFYNTSDRKINFIDIESEINRIASK